MAFNFRRAKETEGSQEYEQKEAGAIYRPQPTGDSGVADNRLILCLSDLWRWKMFNPTQEMVSQYGMVWNGGNLISITNEVESYYFEFQVHRVENYKFPNGKEGFAWVVCPRAQNKYLVNLGYGPMFERPVCPYCEEADRHWATFNELLERKGLPKESYRKLSTEQKAEIAAADPAISKSKQMAISYSPGRRTALFVFDFDRFSNGESVAHQIWIAPNSVGHDLEKICTGRDAVEFYDTTKQDVAIINITKDSSKGKRYTNYSVGYRGKRHQFSPEWQAYLNNRQAMIDPSDYVKMCSTEELRFYLGDAGMNKKVPAQAPGFNAGPPPVAAPPAAFSGAVVAPMPPVAPTAPAFVPVQPSQPVPQMQQVQPVPQMQPVVVPQSPPAPLSPIPPAPPKLVNPTQAPQGSPFPAIPQAPLPQEAPAFVPVTAPAQTYPQELPPDVCPPPNRAVPNRQPPAGDRPALRSWGSK